MTALEQLLSPAIVQSLGWTLLHSLWQGVGIMLVLAGALAALRQRSANVRYLAACTTLLLMVAAPLTTLTLLRNPSGVQLATEPGMTAIAPVPRAAVAPAAPPPHALAEPLGAPVSPQQNQAAGPATESTQPSWRGWLAARVDLALPWIVLFWLGGVLILSLRLLGGWLQAERLTRYRCRPAAQRWQQCLARLAYRLRVSRPVRVLESALAEVPMALGWLRPVILLPASTLTGLTPRQLEAILAHELAHIRRYDYLVNLLQTVVETLLFYHPAVWWISRRIRAEREHCCDDLAVAACGDALVYARALESLEGLRASPARVAVAASGSGLLERIRRLLNVPATHAARPTGWLAGVIAAAAVLGIALNIWFGWTANAALIAQEADTNETAPLYQPIPADRGPTTTITGVVVDEDGQPVGDAPVHALHRRHDEGEDGPRLSQRTDADGRFTFQDLSPEGWWSFWVDDPRYARQWEYETTVQLPFEALDLPLRLKVHKSRLLNGIVSDEAGTPVPNVGVTLVREFLPDGTMVQGWLAYDLQVTTTDNDGRFRLDRLRPGQIVLMLDHPDFARTMSNRIAVDPGDAKATIKKGLTLRGRVVANGKPLEGVSVTVNAINLAHRSLGDWQVTTDGAGEFKVEHMAGFDGESLQYNPIVGVAFIADPSWSSAYYDIGQIDERTLPFLEIAALPKENQPPPDERVRVGQTDLTKVGGMPGQLVGDSTITVRFEGSPKLDSGEPRSIYVYGTGDHTDGVFREQSLDDQGTTVFERLPAGTYGVHTHILSGPNYSTQTVTVGAGQGTSVTLRPGPATVRGVVRAGGEQLTLPSPGSTGCSRLIPGLPGQFENFAGTIAEDGTHEISGLPFGTYNLTVRLPNYSWPHRVRVDVHEAETRLDVDVPQGQITAIAMTDVAPSEDAPLYVYVTRRDEQRPFGARAEVIRLTDTTQFVFRHVPPGTYSLVGRIWRKTGPLCATAVLRSADDQVSVQLRPADRTGWIAGRLTNAGAAGMGDESLHISAALKDAFGYDFTSTSGTSLNKDDTTYRLTDLLVGTYGVLVMSQKTPTVWIPDVEVREGLVRALDITVPVAREVRIQMPFGAANVTRAAWRLRLPSGDWFPFGWIVGSHGSTIMAPTSSFMLAPGEYLLDADLGDAGRIQHPFTVELGEGLQQIEVLTP